MSQAEIQKNRLRNQLQNMNYSEAYPMDELTRRSQMRNLLRDAKVRNFYSDLQIQLRDASLLGSAIIIPEQVEDGITELVKQYSALYNEVLMVPIGISGRVTISVDDVKAIWGNPLAGTVKLDSNLASIELSDNMLSCYTSVNNSTLEESLIDVSLYLEDLLAQAVAYGFDNGVINGVGDGASIFEPKGILLDIPASNKVEESLNTWDHLATSPGLILHNIDLITSGTKDDIGEVIAVMKRKTYYKHAANGENSSLPYPNLNGVRVKFTPAVADNTILLGDFKQYLMGKRNGIRIASSDQVKFVEHKTIFKVVSRFDGQPINNAAFVEITEKPITNA
jgi:HK97 family phage major capsid protein